MAPITVRDIAEAIEAFAPPSLQESWDNAGLQVGSPDMPVAAALLCLDVTEDVLSEALKRGCNLIVSHHPLIFRGLKHLTGATTTERIVIRALQQGVAIYSAHTNLDSTWDGVSHEIAHQLHLTDLRVLCPQPANPDAGLGIIGHTVPTPAIEFLRLLKKTFNVRALRYSSQSPQLVVRRVAICGGAGAEFLRTAVDRKADIYVTGDVKYHDFTSFGSEILIADIGHYESEIGAKRIFSRIIRERFPDFVCYFSECEKSPVDFLI